MSKLLCLILVASALVFPACSLTGTPAGAGLIWTNVSVAENVTSSAAESSKNGSGSITSILGLFAFGDASVESATNRAGITQIHHVDYDLMSFLGLFGHYTITVYGD